jgi:cold shock protein
VTAQVFSASAAPLIGFQVQHTRAARVTAPFLIDALKHRPVIWYSEMFNATKGYGFIQPDSGGSKDVFVHISAVERAGLNDLREGDKVTFDIVSNRGKEAAENLRVK